LLCVIPFICDAWQDASDPGPTATKAKQFIHKEKFHVLVMTLAAQHGQMLFTLFILHLILIKGASGLRPTATKAKQLDASKKFFARFDMGYAGDI
jgi:hypothetical protein